MKPQATLLPVRARRTLGPSDDICTHRSVHCERRESSVPINECLTCARCEGLRYDHGALAVACLASEATSCDAPSDCADRTSVRAIMSGDVVCVRADTELSAVYALFASESISGAPVVAEDGRAVGIISRTDLVRAEVLAPDATVDDLMMPMAFTLPEHASVSQAAALMAYEGIHRVPIVAADGGVVGIVSALDIARWLARHDGYLTRPT